MQKNRVRLQSTINSCDELEGRRSPASLDAGLCLEGTRITLKTQRCLGLRQKDGTSHGLYRLGRRANVTEIKVHIRAVS